MIDIGCLTAPLRDRTLFLEQLEERHRAGLRAACDADPAIWAIYSIRLYGDTFDAAFDAIMDGPRRLPFAIHLNGAVIGLSGWLAPNVDRQTVEIGLTYIVPSARGTDINARIKQLLLDRAFACGMRRVEFRIDQRNTRSHRAIEKIGAVREGVLRAEAIGWNGHVRDTCLYSILADAWRAR